MQVIQRLSGHHVHTQGCKRTEASKLLLELPSRKVRIIDGLFCLRLLLGRVLLRHHRPLGSHGILHFRQVLKRWCQLLLVVCSRHV